MTDNNDRTEMVAGLRALADFLEQHPDLPLPYHIDATPYLCGSDEDDRAAVDLAAGILGVQAYVKTFGQHYEAVCHFGGKVQYRALAIPAATMAKHHAGQSYSDVVQP